MPILFYEQVEQDLARDVNVGRTFQLIGMRIATAHKEQTEKM
jgi:hypothetical protein